MPQISSVPVEVPFPSLRFGEGGRFELQSRERRLLVDGAQAALGNRALDLLAVLASQPDRLVTKGELLDRVWPGLIVEEANLQMQVSNLRKLIGGDAIATVPGRGYRFAAAVFDPQAAEAAPPAAARSPVLSADAPAGPRLFGRDHDLARLLQQLQPGTCVTLVGPSGVGKTRLARAAAAASERSAWVELASLAGGEPVAGTICRALGIAFEGDEALPRLLATLQDQRLLLVLDNAEHVIEACARVAAQLHALPGLRLLVTSQLPLAIRGERIQRLEPLAIEIEGARRPEPAAHAHEAHADDLGDGALAMLVERIAAADHRFAVTPALLPMLRAICEQLDGLPLALEMAAARVPLLGVQRVQQALAERFALLTTGHRDADARHRTLHGALEWSHRLLGPDEQRVFRSLGVFAGGFSLELLHGVVAGDGEAPWTVIDRLGTLADRSLVSVSADEPPRYRLLETMRAFALEQLAAAGEEEGVRRRHAAALLALYTRRLDGDRSLEPRCIAEFENAREAIEWCEPRDFATAVLLTAYAARIATFTPWRSEVLQWVARIAPAVDQRCASLPPDVQAEWWTLIARERTYRLDPGAAEFAWRALALWDPERHPRRAHFATIVCVRAILQPGPDLDRACDELRRRTASTPGLNDIDRLHVQSALVHAAKVRGDRQALVAERLAEVELAAAAGHPQMHDAAESNVVIELIEAGRLAEAADRAFALWARREREGRVADANAPWVVSGLLAALIGTDRRDEMRARLPAAWAACREHVSAPYLPPLIAQAMARQRVPEAMALLGYLERWHEARGLAVVPGEASEVAACREQAVAVLGGAAEVDAHVARGRALSDDDALALVVGVQD